MKKKHFSCYDGCISIFYPYTSSNDYSCKIRYDNYSSCTRDNWRRMWRKRKSWYRCKGNFVDYVGIGSEDIGPWEHGVIFSGSSGTVYSNYTNKKYWHGSSARGSSDFYRSPLVAPNQTSKASVKTYLPNGNHAYWRVDETQN